MIDREKEKVISHLRIIRTWNKVDKAYAHEEVDKKEKAKTVEWIDDALELLKEQEAVEPEVEVLNEIDRLYRCQRCHGYLFYDGQKYCGRCGQGVKWDDI